MKKIIFSLVAFIACTSINAQAGVFDLASYVEANEWSVGLEPEIAVSNGTGAAMNFKPRYGLNEIVNFQGLIGVGSGSRGFRMGGLVDLEWFPDYDRQPGIATPAFMEYSRIEDSGNFSFGVKPMIYKTFQADSATYTPFIAFPFGWNVRDSDMNSFMQVAMGSMFKVSNVEKWRFTIEAGFEVKDSYSYLSGGATYFH